MYESSSCSTSLSTSDIARLFNFSYSIKCVVLSHYDFNLHFLMTSDAAHFFMCLLAILICSFLKCLLKSFGYFFIRLLIFLLLVVRVYIYILNPSFCQMFCKYKLSPPL